jgi:hypothetical protein
MHGMKIKIKIIGLKININLIYIMGSQFIDKAFSFPLSVSFYTSPKTHVAADNCNFCKFC